MSVRTPHNAIAALPHAPPFRFLSEVTGLDHGVRAAGAWIVRGDENFFEGHFPGDPIVPGVLIGEALAQLSGVVVHEGVEPPLSPSRLAQIEIKIHAAVRPPARIELHATLARKLNSLMMFEVSAAVGAEAVVSGRLVLAAAPRSCAESEQCD